MNYITEQVEINPLDYISTKELIKLCKDYVIKYCSLEEGQHFEELFNKGEYEKVRDILEKTLDKTNVEKEKIEQERRYIKHLLTRDLKKNISSAEFQRRIRKIMNVGGVIAIIVLLLVILAIIMVSRRGQFESKNNANIKTKAPCYQYTENDKDFLELIHQLSMIYDKTDEYLKS